MAKHILVVEDEEELCMTLGDRLRSEGYEVEFANDGIAGFERACHHPFDLLILDIMLPSRSGLDVCTDIRRCGMTLPILLLTARGQTVDKVVGLKLGADDYVTKPFDTLELMARVEALLRRKLQTSGSEKPHFLKLGPVTLDTHRAEVTRDGTIVALTAKEYQLLLYFTEHQGITISREELLLQVWGQRSDTLTRTVDMHVASLRQKLETIPKKPELIVTVPGFGYLSGGRTSLHTS